MHTDSPATTWLNVQEARTRELIQTVAAWETLPMTQLLHPPAAGAWSAAECLAHLNSYGAYYLPAIGRVLQQPQPPAVAAFKPGWLGGWFTSLLEPDDEGLPRTRMNAPAAHRPAEVEAAEELALFLEQQHTLLALMEKAKQVNIGKVRVPMSIGPLIKLKLGDTFAFLVAHNFRHVRQAERALVVAKAAAGPVS